MSVNFKKYWLLLCIAFLLVLTFYIFKLDWESSHRQFTFAVLDIGQGDALFIESPTGTQVLIDAGPPKKILSALQKVMSPFDRSIDAFLITNPDQDHIGGFLDVLKTYKVGMVLESGTTSDSKTYENIGTEIKNKKIPNYLVKKGNRFDLGGGVYLDILFPDRDVSSWPTNDGSTVARLTYGNIRIMLTGDSPSKIEKIILSENPSSKLKSTILKVGHHGSKNSSSKEFIKAVSPEYSFISVGADNKYGHPTQQVLDILNEFGSKIFRTDQLGTIIFKSDGVKNSFSQ